MSRIDREKKIVSLMIRIYCRRKEKNKELCKNCIELEKYAHTRLSKCPHGEKKPSCKKCTKHCYKKDMRERIKAVMRFSGPRMLFYSPIEAIRHIFM